MKPSRTKGGFWPWPKPYTYPNTNPNHNPYLRDACFFRSESELSHSWNIRLNTGITNPNLRSGEVHGRYPRMKRMWKLACVNAPHAPKTDGVGYVKSYHTERKRADMRNNPEPRRNGARWEQRPVQRDWDKNMNTNLPRWRAVPTHEHPKHNPNAQPWIYSNP